MIGRDERVTLFLHIITIFLLSGTTVSSLWAVKKVPSVIPSPICIKFRLLYRLSLRYPSLTRIIRVLYVATHIPFLLPVFRFLLVLLPL